MADVEPSSSSQTIANKLFPCHSCGGYHYLDDCIYTLTWTEWLEYQAHYMPSQLEQISGMADVPEHQRKAEWLVQRVQELDDLAAVSRPNFLSNTRLKADLMTKSNTDMFWDDQLWKEKLGPHTPYQARKKQLLTGARRQSDFDTGQTSKTGIADDDTLALKRLKAAGSSHTGNVSAFDEEDSEDELSLSAVRAEFGPRLPRTSKATLLKT